MAPIYLGKRVLPSSFRYIENLANCTPPWMTDRKALWCKQKYELDMTVTMYRSYLSFLTDISASDASSGKCLTPCKVKRYQAKEYGMKPDKHHGMEILFEKEVKVTKSAWNIGPMSLISKIGGFIGISKNFLWLVIMVFSSVGVLISKLKTQK